MGDAAAVVRWLAQSNIYPPHACWKVLDTLVRFDAAPDLIKAVLEAYNVHAFPPLAAAPPPHSHVIESEDEDSSNAEGGVPPSSPLGFEVPDAMIEDQGFRAIPAPNTVFMVDTVTGDDDAPDTSYFILREYNAAGSRIQWIYLPHQMDVEFSPDWADRIAAITAAGATAAFLSDHTQTLGNPGTWTEVTERVVWCATPAEPASGLIYIVGSYQNQEVVEDDLITWFINRLLTIGRDGGKKLKKTFESSSTPRSRVYVQHGWPVNTGRCKICGYKRPITHSICWRTNNVVDGIGSTCAAKIKAALNLRFCDKDDQEAVATCIDAAQTALTQ